MNNLRNSVQLIGFIGKNPEMKELTNGAKVAKVSIATTESYKNDKGEYIDQTTWHNLVGWSYTAERMMKQMQKGLEVFIQGKLVQRSYEDSNSIKRYVTEVRIVNFLMMDRQARKMNQEAAKVTEGKTIVPFN